MIASIVRQSPEVVHGLGCLEVQNKHLETSPFCVSMEFLQELVELFFAINITIGRFDTCVTWSNIRLRIGNPVIKKVFESNERLVEGEELFLLSIFSALKSLFDVRPDLGRTLLGVNQFSIKDKIFNLSADMQIRN